jgi:hypothetical protein
LDKKWNEICCENILMWLFFFVQELSFWIQERNWKFFAMKS